jgi:hypothetical protein
MKKQLILLSCIVAVTLSQVIYSDGTATCDVRLGKKYNPKTLAEVGSCPVIGFPDSNSYEEAYFVYNTDRSKLFYVDTSLHRVGLNASFGQYNTPGPYFDGAKMYAVGSLLVPNGNGNRYNALCEVDQDTLTVNEIIQNPADGVIQPLRNGIVNGVAYYLTSTTFYRYDLVSKTIIQSSPVENSDGCTYSNSVLIGDTIVCGVASMKIIRFKFTANSISVIDTIQLASNSYSQTRAVQWGWETIVLYTDNYDNSKVYFMRYQCGGGNGGGGCGLRSLITVDLATFTYKIKSNLPDSEQQNIGGSWITTGFVVANGVLNYANYAFNYASDGADITYVSYSVEEDTLVSKTIIVDGGDFPAVNQFDTTSAPTSTTAGPNSTTTTTKAPSTSTSTTKAPTTATTASPNQSENLSGENRATSGSAKIIIGALSALVFVLTV